MGGGEVLRGRGWLRKGAGKAPLAHGVSGVRGPARRLAVPEGEKGALGRKIIKNGLKDVGTVRGEPPASAPGWWLRAGSA